MFRKVIISHLGELTHDMRTVGDVIRYRIYYDNLTRQSVDIVIIDKLDKNLSHVQASNDGQYDLRTHTVIWKVRGVLPRQSAYVELVARIYSVGVIHNQAFLVGVRRKKTNVVETTVVASPQLGWIPFSTDGKQKEPPRYYMKDETTTGLTVNFNIDGMFVNEIKIEGVTYHHLSIPCKATMLDLGKPQLPIVGALIEVPHGVNITATIFKSSSITLKDYNVYPVQEPIPRQTRPRRPPFKINSATYLADTQYPGVLARIQAEDIGVVRGHRLVFLKVNPLQYNPVTRQMQAFFNIEVRLEYNHPGQIQRIAKRIESPEFEALLQNSVLNYKQPERFGRGGDYEKEPNGCHYLILTHPNFYTSSDANNPVVRLQNWKRRKGLITHVMDVTSIQGGNTAASIRAFIQNAYDNWYPAPTYVLLVGDADFIPRNDGILHYEHVDSGDNDTPIGTDLSYATLDGTDYFPDIFIGRLPVDSLAQAGDVVDKIIQYEQNPPATPANANYYQDTSLVCLFEDDDWINGNGTEDLSFRIIEFAEAIRTYLNGQGYNARRIYSRSGGFAQGPQRYENGTALPVELTLNGNPTAGIPGFAWNGGAADIRAAINGGNFLITYDGHGNPTSWARPGFNTGNFPGLNNANLYPVVFSFACMTGWFDNEINPNNVDTDPYSAGVQGLGVNDESFCELLLRRANAGAVAVIGSTRISWENNDVMMLGAYKAIWPDFAPNPPTSLSLPQMQMGPLVRMGQILNFCKIYMANTYEHNFHRESSFEMYHLFGDPEMPIWTQAPVRLNVDCPQGLGSAGVQDFIVKVTDQVTGNPVQSATVTLTRRVTTGGNPVDRIIESQLTNPDGIARFTLNNIGDGDIDITVTALNYLPHTAVIKVATGGAVLNRLDPDNGPEGQTIHVGGQDFSGSENVDIYFGSQLVKTVAAQGGSFGQIGADVDIQVASPHQLGPMNVMLVGQQSGRYAVEVFQVRSKNPVDLWTYSQLDSSTWGLNPGGGNPIWDNPEIQLYEGANMVNSNNLVVGHTYTMKVKVHNDTAFTANQAKVVFRWANFGIGGPWYDFHTVALNVPPGGATAEAPFTPGQTGHVCVLAEIYHTEDITPSNNQGQENLHVGPTSSPAKVCFLVWNRTKKPAAVYLEVRQLIKPDKIGKERLWATKVIHPDPQVLQPGERSEACVIVDPDVADVKKGTKAEFAVTGFIDGEMIGGVNLVIVKQ
jgi:hypothetical protein